MANKHMNKDLIESIDSAENSNEEFFSVNFGSNKVKIFFEEEACDWVWNYKYLHQQRAIDIKTQLNSSLQLKKLALITYFFRFIIPDISNLNEHISTQTRSILDIGAGIGLFDLFLNQIFNHKASFDLIEVEKLNEIEHVTNNPEYSKKLDAGIKIKPVQTLKKLMIANNAENINIISNTSIDEYHHKKYAYRHHTTPQFHYFLAPSCLYIHSYFQLVADKIACTAFHVAHPHITHGVQNLHQKCYSLALQGSHM
jgi:hypothetical protein